MPEQAPGATMMVSLAGRQQMGVGGKAAQGPQIKFLIDIFRRQPGLSNLPNQFLVGFDQPIGMGCRQPFDKWRVTRDFIVRQGLGDGRYLDLACGHVLYVAL